MKLRGKVALVTGARQGIGRGIAEVFAQEGADVVINDICCDEETEAVAAKIRAQGRRAIIVQGDVSKRADVERMFEEARQWGPLDTRVKMAGCGPFSPWLEFT